MTPEVIVQLFVNTLIALFSLIVFFISYRVSKYFQKSATTPLQYRLEKESYLATTLTKYLFAIKIPLFLFFIFSLEKLATLLPGAMCATGVVNATVYGPYLLLIKLLNLYLFAYWLVLNSVDLKDVNLPYTPMKFKLLLVFISLLLVEIVLESVMYFSIDMKSIVDCCGVVFSSSDGSYMAWLIGAPFWMQLTLFLLTFVVLFIAYVREYYHIYALFSLLFLVVALITLIGVFGTYIYELPTHHCPFCMLSIEYGHIGYLLYTLLFVGTFFGILLTLIDFEVKRKQRYKNISMLAISSYTLIVLAYPLLYFIKHGVLL